MWGITDPAGSTSACRRFRSPTASLSPLELADIWPRVASLSGTATFTRCADRIAGTGARGARAAGPAALQHEPTKSTGCWPCWRNWNRRSESRTSMDDHRDDPRNSNCAATIGCSSSGATANAARSACRRLRKACPCATCREKRAAPPSLPADLPVLSLAEARPLAILGMKPVGNYAYSIAFSATATTRASSRSNSCATGCGSSGLMRKITPKQEKRTHGHRVHRGHGELKLRILSPCPL